MTPQLGNIVFIVWRESVEALLVIGILNAWLRHQNDRLAFAQATRYLWSGVAAGILFAVAFAFALIWLGDALPDEAQQTYQTAAVLIAAALIVQMVLWMRRNSRDLKRNLQSSLSEAASQSRWWGVFTLSLIAVAREGGETAVFLYGTLGAGPAAGWPAQALAVSAGFAAAAVSYWALQLSGRYISWRIFFRVTEVMLLFLAASLLLTGVDNLADLGVIPSLSGRLWDSSRFLPDSGAAGGLVSALTGYRAKPDLLELVAYTAYWILILWLLSFFRPARRPA